MIIEGIVTTTNPDGGMHVAAMGPAVDNGERLAGRITRLLLRPFATSHTAANLARVPAGVFHLTDDVLLVARIVAGQLDDVPASRPADCVPGRVLSIFGLVWSGSWIDVNRKSTISGRIRSGP